MFAGIEFIDSYGVGELVRSYSLVRRLGGDIKLAEVREMVFRILEIAGLNKSFEIYPTKDMAIRTFE